MLATICGGGIGWMLSCDGVDAGALDPVAQPQVVGAARERHGQRRRPARAQDLAGGVEVGVAGVGEVVA